MPFGFFLSILEKVWSLTTCTEFRAAAGQYAEDTRFAEHVEALNEASTEVSSLVAALRGASVHRRLHHNPPSWRRNHQARLHQTANRWTPLSHPGYPRAGETPGSQEAHYPSLNLGVQRTARCSGRESRGWLTVSAPSCVSELEAPWDSGGRSYPVFSASSNR